MEIQVNVSITPETMEALKSLIAVQVPQPTEAKPKRGKAAKPAQEEEETVEDLDEDETEEVDETEDEELDEDESEDEDADEDEESEDEEDGKIDPKQLMQLKKALNSYSSKHGKPKAVKILHKFAKVSQDVKAKDFSKILKALKI